MSSSGRGGPWGRNTVVKVLGGEIHFRTVGQTPDDWLMTVNQYGARARNLTRVFDALKPGFVRVVRSRFAREGPGWARLAPSTIRSRQYPGQPILQQTRKMMGSLLGGSGMIWRPGPRSLQYGSSVKYYPFHQLGTSKMPARTMVVYTNDLGRELEQRTLRWIHLGRP